MAAIQDLAEACLQKHLFCGGMIAINSFWQLVKYFVGRSFKPVSSHVQLALRTRTKQAVCEAGESRSSREERQGLPSQLRCDVSKNGVIAVIFCSGLYTSAHWQDCLGCSILDCLH